ncbi:MAG: hypothetical protein VW239_07355 [Candidatus Nanopelagicales bacterium]
MNTRDTGLMQFPHLRHGVFDPRLTYLLVILAPRAFPPPDSSAVA